MSPSHSEMQQFVDQINRQFSAQALWSGYRIRTFKRSNLVISGSQDWMYYHNLDLVFKKVIFFNLPEYWKDTWVETEDLFRLSSPVEFASHFPDFEVGDRHVFAIDLLLDLNNNLEKHTYFIVAANAFYFRLEPVGDGIWDYEDPLGSVRLTCKENRVRPAR